MNVTKAAGAFRAAQEKYRTAFGDYFANEMPALPDDRFWPLQAVFVQEVISFRFNYGRTNGVEQAAREFFRKPLAGDCSGVEYTMEEAIRFARTWRSISRSLYAPLFEIVQDKGDDAYGDLLDALPLAGREVVNRSQRNEVANQARLHALVSAGCGGDSNFAGLILHGENYVGMHLLDAAQEYFALSASDSARAKDNE